MSRALWKWFAGVAGASLTAFISIWAAGFLNEIITSPARVICFVKEAFAEPAPATGFTILLSDLENDADRIQTRHVASYLQREGFDFTQTCRVMAFNPYAQLSSKAEQRAVERGRKWLQKRNADLLVWGQVVGNKDSLQLSFLSKQNEKTSGAEPPKLTRTKLPASFDDRFETQLEAMILAYSIAQSEHKQEDLLQKLESAAEQLESLAESEIDLTREQRKELYEALGFAGTTIAGHSSNWTWFEKAIDAYQAALEASERTSIDLAVLRTKLDDTLQLLGKHTEAAKAYQTALDGWTKEQIRSWEATISGWFPPAQARRGTSP